MRGPWEFTEAGLGPTPWLLRAFGFTQVKHLPWGKRERGRVGGGRRHRYAVFLGGSTAQKKAEA